MIYFLLVNLYLIYQKHIYPSECVFWVFRQVGDRLLYHIDVHGHFGSSIIMVHCNVLGYVIAFLQKIFVMSLFSETKDLVFKSGSEIFEAILLWFRLGATIQLTLLFPHPWISLNKYLMYSTKCSDILLVYLDTFIPFWGYSFV